MSQNNALESISFGASVFLFGKVVLNICTFILNAILSRVLGASIYGVFAFSITTVNILYIFSNAGSDKSLLKYLPEYDEQQLNHKVTTIAFSTSILLGIIILLILVNFNSYINHVTINDDLYQELLPLLGIYLLVETILKIMGAVFRGLEMATTEVILNKIIYPIFRLIAVLIGVYFSLNLISIFGLLVTAGLVSAVYGSHQLIHQDFKPNFNISKSRIIKYYNFSIPLGFKDIASFLYARVDILMVGMFLSSTSVGIYNIAILLSGMITIPLAAFNHLFPSIASGLFAKDKSSEISTVFSTVTRWSITLSLFAGIYMMLFRNEMMSIFGDEFSAGSVVLILLVAGQIVNSGAGPSGYILMMAEHQYLIVFNQWLFGLLNILLNYILISEYGIFGAAFATMTTLILLNSVRIIEVYYLVNIHPYSKSYIKIVPPVIAMIVVGNLLSRYLEGIVLLVIGGIVSILIFFGLLIGLGLEKEEYSIAKKIWDKN